MRYPQFLTDGGRLGFIAPSFGCNIEPYKSAFDNAKRKFVDMGYSTIDGPNAYAGDGIGISSTPQQCADEINLFFKNDMSDVVFSCGGGELMCEDLPFVDFEAIKASKPKWFMGYSDNTNLTFLLNTLCDTASVYGPCAPTFGMEQWHQAIEDAFDLIRGNKTEFSSYGKWERESLKTEENPLAPYNVTEESVRRLYIGNKKVDSLTMSGRLLGGCLDCLNNLVGTKFDKVAKFNEKYGNDGILWFLESCDLNMMDLRRTVWHLENAGWFDKCSGFIIGRPLHYDEEFMGLDRFTAVLEIIKHHNVPIMFDADLGHLPPAIPIVSGAKASLKAEGNEYRISYEIKNAPNL